ncbi:SipW-dependent-type signal peptide-containing protein [Haloarcula sp. JP-L23]|uniref:SipW-dependent-type signal peptide-containing protein n=1 Tax=Haloarcula sp. JP-L23 TaxID=2716717 RepID=UPI001D0437DB
MTNDNIIELSRRKVLAGIGTVGVASAGAGLGTTAFFSDEETFEGNTLTAGKLDLKMDWQEHYSDWSSDEEQYAGMASTKDTADYVLPGGDAGEPIMLKFSDEDGFMAATSVEAFPDTDNDTINDYDATLEALTDSQPNPGDICNIGADTPEDLDPTNGLRTRNSDTYDEENEEYKSLISLDDVKPGDFGEVTFSLHLCDNPGYLWMFADNISGSENGLTEPERKDDDEDQTLDADGNVVLKDSDDSDGGTVELLDKIQARVWYDGSSGTDSVASSGNNRKEEFEPLVGEGISDVPTLRGSLREVLNSLDSDPGVPLDASRFCSTHITDGIDLSDTTTDPVEYECYETTDVQPRCEDFFSDDVIDAAPRWEGGELPTSDTTLTKTIGDYEYKVELVVNNTDDGQPSEVELENIRFKNTTDSSTGSAYAAGVIVKGGNRGNICVPPNGESPSSDPDGPDEGADDSDGKKWFTAPTNPGGNEDPGISYIELCLIRGPKDGEVPPPDGGPRDCLVNSTTAYLGFEWWLPVNHGNEVQTDSVSFDLGFYTEQCRHNDGSGMQRQ